MGLSSKKNGWSCDEKADLKVPPLLRRGLFRVLVRRSLPCVWRALEHRRVDLLVERDPRQRALDDQLPVSGDRRLKRNAQPADLPIVRERLFLPSALDSRLELLLHDEH